MLRIFEDQISQNYKAKCVTGIVEKVIYYFLKGFNNNNEVFHIE